MCFIQWIYGVSASATKHNGDTDTPLTKKEALAVICLRDSDPFYIDKLTIRELKYLISMIDAQERQWSFTCKKYVAALKRLEEEATVAEV